MMILKNGIPFRELLEFKGPARMITRVVSKHMSKESMQEMV